MSIIKTVLLALLPVIALLAGAVGVAPAAWAGYGWQAIYYSPSTGSIGTAWDYPTAASAMTAAQNSCSVVDCQMAGVSAGCVALAIGYYSWHGGYGVTMLDANYQAVRANGSSIDTRVVCP